MFHRLLLVYNTPLKQRNEHVLRLRLSYLDTGVALRFVGLRASRYATTHDATLAFRMSHIRTATVVSLTCFR
jgi:hypothetical protein